VLFCSLYQIRDQVKSFLQHGINGTEGVFHLVFAVDEGVVESDHNEDEDYENDEWYEIHSWWFLFEAKIMNNE
ncbi:MAG: hypothetical protein KBF79_13125, partial [Saprospiraceae bacterium]|nr:hypothetical protein [Saprospiraceae bacterium]